MIQTKANRLWTIIPATLLISGVLFGVVSCQVSLWRECRSDHSWLYCMRVLGGK